MTAKTPNDLNLLANPLGFTKGILRLECYPWTERILLDLDKPGTVAVRAANGAGKTTRLAAPAAAWHASVFPNSLTVCTAGVYRQVKEQLFDALKAHSHKFTGWQFNEAQVIAHNGSRILGFSTDDPGKFEGWHGGNGSDGRGPLMVIIDEAKSVPDSIMEAVERCQPQRLLVISSPGGTSGFFYEAFHARRKFFKTHKVTAADCPHISPEWIAQQIEKYGESHPLVASMIFAEFMTAGEDGAIIPLAWIEQLLTNPPPLKAAAEIGLTEERQAGIDFAAGGDENVMALRTGNKVSIVAAWREKNTMRAVGKFIGLFQEHNLKPEEIAADAGGLGIPMCDALAEAGWPVIRVNNGSEPRDSRYANKGAEMYYHARRLIERGEVILPNDQALIAQLSSRKGWPNSKGKLALEPKEDLRSRGLPSPDRADALTLALFPHLERIYVA